MRSRSFPLAVLLALLLAVGGCGSQESQSTKPGGAKLPTVTVAEDLGVLVPADTDVLIYAPNLESLMGEVGKVMAIFDEDMAAEVNLDKMREQLPIGDLMDADKPIAVALKIPVRAEPIPTLITSVSDVAAAQERAKGARLAEMPTSGSYVAMLLDKGEPAPKGSTAPAIAKDIPVGDVVIRANLAALRSTFADQIDEAFGEMKKGVDRGLPKDTPFDMSGFMDNMLKGVKTFLDSAEGLDIVMDVDGSIVNLKGVLSVKAGSEMDGLGKGVTDASSVANRLPGGFPVAFLASGDMTEMPPWLQELIDAALEMYPEDLATLLKKSMEKQKDFAGLMGNLHGGVFRIDEGGIAFVAVNQVTDTDAYMKASEEYYQDKEMTELLARVGVEMQMLPPTTVAGTAVNHQRFSMDFQKLMSNFAEGKEIPADKLEVINEMVAKVLGPDGLVIHTAAVDGYVVTVMGGEELIEQAINAAKGTGTLKADLAASLKAAGETPGFLVYLDGRALAKGVLDFARNIMPPEQAGNIPTCPDGNPVPLVIYGGAEGRHYMGGFNVDLQSIMDLIQDFSK